MLIEILIYILTQIVSAFGLLFGYTGQAPLLLPFGIDAALQNVVGIWNAFIVTFPYAEIGWHMFLYFILPFELLMLAMKFIMGSRLPTHE